MGTSEKDKRINTLKRDLDKISQQLSTSKAKERQHQYRLIELDNEKHELSKQLDDEINQRKLVADEKTQERQNLKQQIKQEQEKAKEAANTLCEIKEELNEKVQQVDMNKDFQEKYDNLKLEHDRVCDERREQQKKLAAETKAVKKLTEQAKALKHDVHL